MADLVTEFVAEQQRCRELLQQYAEVSRLPGVNVSFAVAAIKHTLAGAELAAASGDTVAMIRLLGEMRVLE